MNTQTQHTPWTADAETFNGQLERLHIGRKGRSLTLCIERESDLTNEEQEQAMHHVHHAINSHASLVAENKRLRDFAESFLTWAEQMRSVGRSWPGLSARESEARAALNPEATT